MWHLQLHRCVLMKILSDGVQAERIFAYLVEELGSAQVQKRPSHRELDLILRLDSLPSLHADALGLQKAVAIHMHVKLPLKLCARSQLSPEIQLRVGISRTVLGVQRTQILYDRVLRQINKICEGLLCRPMALSDPARHTELPLSSLSACPGQNSSARQSLCGMWATTGAYLF